MNGRNFTRPPWASLGAPADLTELVRAMGSDRKRLGVGAVCVVKRHEVEERSRDGWALAMVVHSTELACERNQYGYRGAMVTPPLVEDVPLFVLIRGYDTELAAAREETAKWKVERDNAAKDWHDAERKLRTVEKERDDARGERDAFKLAAERQESRARTREEQVAKLEADLAKVRREIGDAEWKRITGSK